MSRHHVTVRLGLATDEDAIIGYDPPMRTYFLQGFEDPETEDLALWMGTRLEEYPTLPALLDQASSKGFSVERLTPEMIADMACEEIGPHTPSLVEHGWPLR